jgi:type IV pilus assembly protein PilV
MTISATRSSQSGVALLEALIAILLFSFSILALVGLQSVMIRSSMDAKFRADAAYLANQIIGRMWVDQANITTNYPLNAAAGLCAAGTNASAHPPVASWLSDIGRALPGTGTLRQQITVGANNLVTVTICWKLPQETTTHNYTATAQIN